MRLRGVARLLEEASLRMMTPDAVSLDHSQAARAALAASFVTHSGQTPILKRLTPFQRTFLDLAFLYFPDNYFVDVLRWRCGWVVRLSCADKQP
jgi:hypothetical protein